LLFIAFIGGVSVLSSCKSKVVLPSREEGDMIKLEYENMGINMDSVDRKAKEKLEKRILKVEKHRKKVLRKEQKLAGKKKHLSPKDINKNYAKEEKLKNDVRKYHQKFIYSRQAPEVRKRMKQNMRKAKRRYRKSH